MFAADIQLLACVLACWLLNHWTEAGAVASRLDLLPALQRQSMTGEAPTYYLAAGEDWWPGDAPQISVLMAEQPLNFHVEPMRSQVGLQSVQLLFKCSATDSKFEEVLLEDSMQSSPHCQPLRPFSLVRLSSSLYRLTLLRENELPFEQALRHSLEFRLRLNFYQGVLESASLFVFNFDALSKVPPDTERRPEDQTATLYYLRSFQITEFVPIVTNLRLWDYYFVNYMNRVISNPNESTVSIQIFRNEFVDVLKQAEPMVRNLLSMTIYYSQNCSDSNLFVEVLATAGVGGTVGQNSFKASKPLFLLEPDSGTLFFSSSGFAFLSRLRRLQFNFLDVCLNISTKGELWPYSMPFRVSRFELPRRERTHRTSRSIDLAELNRKAIWTSPFLHWPIPTVPPSPIPTVPPSPIPTVTPSPIPTVTPSPIPTVTPSPIPTVTPSPIPTVTPSPIPTVTPGTEPTKQSQTTKRPTIAPCFLAGNKSSSAIQIPANLLNLSLSCPMFCSNDVRFQAGFNGSHCSHPGSSDVDSRPPCSKFFSASPTSCEIDLIGPISQMHNGTYIIIGGGVKYTYHVTVVSLPVFTPDSLSAETLDFNPRFEPANLNCAVTYSGIQPVDIVPQFKLFERFQPGIKWVDVSPQIFSDKVLDGDPQGIVMNISRLENRSELSIRMSSKKAEPWWVSWKAAFVCSVSVAKSDARLFGLPEYRVRACWNLAFDKNLKQIARSGASALSSVLSLCAVLPLLHFSCSLCNNLMN